MWRRGSSRRRRPASTTASRLWNGMGNAKDGACGRNMGEWEEVSISYRDSDGHYCECCGKHVPRYMYVACVDGAKHRFCSPDCADLFEWYWLPRYSARQRGTAT